MASKAQNVIEAIEELIAIKDRDPETMMKEDYDRRNELANYLFGTSSLHDAFSHKHPEFCLSTVLWIMDYGPLHRLKSSPQTEVYSSDDYLGAVIRVYPKKRNLFTCLSDAQTEPNGLYLYFEEHSNILWFDVDHKIIHRYDPQISKDDKEAKPVDGALRSFFKKILPGYEYLGNTLSSKDCIQDVRRQERGHLDCFCQEYTLLYAWNRLLGMTHEEAARNLVKDRANILVRIKDFYRYMANLD